MLYAFVGIFDYFYSGQTKLEEINILYTATVAFFALIILGLSIVALFLFIKNKFAKITLVMPAFHLAFFALTIIVGLVLGFSSGIQGQSITEAVISGSVYLLALISSIFELVFSIYILYKFK